MCCTPKMLLCRMSVTTNISHIIEKTYCIFYCCCCLWSTFLVYIFSAIKFLTFKAGMQSTITFNNRLCKWLRVSSSSISMSKTWIWMFGLLFPVFQSWVARSDLYKKQLLLWLSVFIITNSTVKYIFFYM